MPFKNESEKAVAEMQSEDSKLETLELEVKLKNKDHEEIALKCELWGCGKTPRVTLEVPAWENCPRMYVVMTLDEFDIVAEHVARFRKLMEVANV